MLFIGIDLGASFIKGAVLDLDALCLKHVHRIPFPQFITGIHPLHREVDPTKIVTAVRQLIEQLLPQAPNCAGIVMCGQMHGLVLANEHGEQLSNFVSWQDQRALMPHPSGKGTHFDVLVQKVTQTERQQLGNELRPGLPLSVLFWMAEEKYLPNAGSIPASLADFVVANLCGSPPTTEATNAAAHGALNLVSQEWDRTVLAKLGQDRLKWPALRYLGEVVGFLKAGSTSVPCYTPIGDQQCALLGACLEDGELSLNIATGSQVSMICPELEFGNYQTRPFFDGKFIKTVTHIPAGRSLNALINLLTELARMQDREIPDSWAYIERCVANIHETDLNVNISFFNGACGDHGQILNMREENMTVGHLFRAAFQCMADNYYICALRLSPEQSWTNLVFSGGLAQKLEVLREVIQNRFQVGYRLSVSKEDTLLGLLVLAQFCSKTTQSISQSAAIIRQKVTDN